MSRTAFAALTVLAVGLAATAGAEAPPPPQRCAAFLVPTNHLAGDGVTWKEYGGTKKAGVVSSELPSGWTAVGGSTVPLPSEHSAVVMACGAGA